jgi:hypothetical protein
MNADELGFTACGGNGQVFPTLEYRISNLGLTEAT